VGLECDAAGFDDVAGFDGAGFDGVEVLL